MIKVLTNMVNIYSLVVLNKMSRPGHTVVILLSRSVQGMSQYLDVCSFISSSMQCYPLYNTFRITEHRSQNSELELRTTFCILMRASYPYSLFNRHVTRQLSPWVPSLNYTKNVRANIFWAVNSQHPIRQSRLLSGLHRNIITLQHCSSEAFRAYFIFHSGLQLCRVQQSCRVTHCSAPHVTILTHHITHQTLEIARISFTVLL